MHTAYFKSLSLAATVAVAVFLLIMNVPAMAQDAGSGQEAEGAPGAQQDFSDVELERAASAYSTVVQISQEFQQDIQDVESQDKRLELQNQANKKMVTAVENIGLDVETYNRIIAQVQSDDSTRKRFMEKVQTMQ